METINTAGPNRLAPEQQFAVGSVPVDIGILRGILGNAPSFDDLLRSIPDHFPTNIGHRIAKRTDRSAGPDAVWRWRGSVCQANGYPQLSYEDQHTGKRTTRSVHRIIMEIILGRRLKRSDYVLHAEGVPRTDVNPRHLRIGTQRENIGQARAEGRLRGGGHRVNAELAKKIADLHHVHGYSIATIAHRFGFSFNTIKSVVTGRSHARATGCVYAPGKPGRPRKRELVISSGEVRRRAARSMGAVI